MTKGYHRGPFCRKSLGKPRLIFVAIFVLCYHVPHIGMSYAAEIAGQPWQIETKMERGSMGTMGKQNDRRRPLFGMQLCLGLVFLVLGSSAQVNAQTVKIVVSSQAGDRMSSRADLSL